MLTVKLVQTAGTERDGRRHGIHLQGSSGLAGRQAPEERGELLHPSPRVRGSGSEMRWSRTSGAPGGPVLTTSQLAPSHALPDSLPAAGWVKVHSMRPSRPKYHAENSSEALKWEYLA